MKKLFIILSIIIIPGTVIFSQTHFQVVYTGNPYLAMNIYITAATIDGVNLTTGDEIGIYDGEYCVGAGVLSGEISTYLALVAATDDPNTTEIDGFTVGHGISYKLWDTSEGIEVSNVTPDYTSGDGTFSSQGMAMLALSGITNLPPEVAKPVSDLTIDEDSPAFDLADLDTVFADQDPGDVLSFSVTNKDLNVSCTINIENIIGLSLEPDWNGQDSIWITATDLAGESVTDTVVIIVNPVNDSPILANPVADFTMNEDDDDLIFADFNVVFNDIDEDELTFSAQSDTSAVSVTIDAVNAVTLSLSADWNGSAEIILSASDAEYSVDDTVVVTVNAVNDPPVIVDPIADVLLNEDGPDSLIADLDDVFEDIDSDLQFSGESSEEHVQVNISSENGVLISVDPNWNGQVTSIFSATDGEYTVADTVIIFVGSVNDDPTTPIILLPANGTELLPEGYLVWTFSTDVDFNDHIAYRIQLDTNSDFSNPVIDETDINLSTILSSVKNRWKADDLCLTAVKNQRQVNSKLADSAYVIQIEDLTNYANLLDNTIYYWRIQAADINGGKSAWTNGSHNFFFNKINNPPSAVVAGFSPADSMSISSLTPVISWNASADPDLSDDPGKLHYTLQISSSSKFSSILHEYQTDPGINYVGVDGLTDDAIFFYHIKSYDDEGLSSDWSGAQAFIVNTKLDPPNSFSLMLPISGFVDTLKTGDTLPVEFKWEGTDDPDFGDYVAKYGLFYSHDSMFTSIDESEGIIVGSDTLTSIEFAQGTYYWRVAAFDTDSLSTIIPDLSENPWKFSIISAVGIPIFPKLPEIYSLSQNYPNPFNPSTTIAYQLPKSSFVTLTIYDISGKLVNRLVNEQKPAGYYSAMWNAENVSSGLYIYVFEVEGFRSVRKCLVVK
jgi:hypothetical protein